MVVFFFFQAEDGIRDESVTGVQTCALPICRTGLVQLRVERLRQLHGWTSSTKPATALLLPARRPGLRSAQMRSRRVSSEVIGQAPSDQLAMIVQVMADEGWCRLVTETPA